MANKQPFYLFVALYAMFNDKDPETYAQKFGSNCIKTWNSSMKSIKDQFKLTSPQVREVLYFAYVHDPLNDRKLYGKLNSFYKVTSIYKRWRELNTKEIDSKGFHTVLWETKPENMSALDEELLKDFEKVDGLY